jgi:DEAD/DEAH box helicase domain-containing protein
VQNFDALLPVQELPKFDFAGWRIWVNVHQNAIYNCLELLPTKAIDKAQWEEFWRIFNIFQSDRFVVAQDADQKEGDSDIDLFSEIKALYDETLHDLIQQAINKGWVIAGNAEFLDSWMDEADNVLADAELVLTVPKIVVEPRSIESRKIFETAGFRIYALNQLNDMKL